MPISSVFKTTTNPDSPLDASSGDLSKPGVSDFLTVQSLTNFAAMSGAIAVAWGALKTLNSVTFAGIWVPFLFALAWGVVSVLMSLDGLKKTAAGKLDPGSLGGAIFIAFINTLVLTSAVIGASPKATP